jgi:hypothetical protein
VVRKVSSDWEREDATKDDSQLAMQQALAIAVAEEATHTGLSRSELGNDMTDYPPAVPLERCL